MATTPIEKAMKAQGEIDAKSRSLRCILCGVRSAREMLREILTDAARNRRKYGSLGLPAVHKVLVDEGGYTGSYGAMLMHLKKHEADLWERWSGRGEG